MSTTKDEEIEWVYESVLQYIKSTAFRTPIKSFIDEHCLIFDEGEENSFEHTRIHNEFKKMVETLLDYLLADLEITQEQFLRSAKYGLESENKKYFEQIIACDNYIYFKSLMVKRNLQLQDETYKMMVGKKIIDNNENNVALNENNLNKLLGKDKDYVELLKKQEQIELENALKMSMILEEEKKKLSFMEEEEYKLALAVSKSLANNEVHLYKNKEEEISLFDPSTLVKKGRKDNDNVSNNKVIHTPTPQGNISVAQNKVQEKPIINTSNPVISTVKKEFDFSHLNMNNNNNNLQIHDNFSNNLIQKTEKLTFDTSEDVPQRSNNTNSINFEDQIPLTNTIKQPIEDVHIVKQQTEEVKPIIVSSIPVVKTEKIINTQVTETLNPIPVNNLSENDQKILDNIFGYQKNSQDITSTRVVENTNSNINISNSLIKPIVDENIENKVNSEPTFKKEILVEFNNLSQTANVSKVVLGDIKTKKNIPSLSNDPIAFLDKQFNFKSVKQNELIKPEPVQQEANNEDINKIYEDLQKEKAEKLKEYRNMVLQMKKEKRENKLEEEKKEEKSLVDDKMLSEETKKRLEMRKLLADRLSGNKK